jgi:hypothetical protein
MAFRRLVPVLGLAALLMGATLGGFTMLSGGAPAAAAPSLARLQQGVTVSGVVTMGGGTCFPDAVLVDCTGAVLEQLRGPGGTAYFAPFIGRWVDIGGTRRTCSGGGYIDVTSLQAAFGPCGSGGTATPSTPQPTVTTGPSPTPLPVPATATPVVVTCARATVAVRASAVTASAINRNFLYILRPLFEG